MVHVGQLERIAVAGVHFRPVRRALGITAFGINGYTADAGERVIEEHDETGSGAGVHEELYLVIAGAATFELDGRAATLPTGTLVFVPDPKTRRGAIASEDGTTVVVIGGRPGAALPTSPFEHWFAAEPAYAAGRYAEAEPIVLAGLRASRPPDDALPAGLLHGARRPARRGRGAPPPGPLGRSGAPEVDRAATPTSTRCATGPIGRAETRGAGALAGTLQVSMPKGLLDELNPEQRRAVEAVQGAVLIVAGAGSGKTRVLTHRIAHLVRDYGVKPWEILAITFTNRAAKEMLERVDDLLGARSRGMWVMTFHAACARILRAEAERIGFRPGFTIYDQADQIRVVKDVLEDELDKDPKRYPPRGIQARISDAKNRLIGPEQFAAEVSGFFDQTVSDVYSGYQRRLTQAGAMDFDDLLAHAVKLLEDVPDVREKWQAKFKHVMVDEYQDTNHAQ